MSKILFLMEGAVEDINLIKIIEKKFISRQDNKIIISYNTNIHQLYKQLKLDEDVGITLLDLLNEQGKIDYKKNGLESIREISQIFIFFDLDSHDGYVKKYGCDHICELIKYFCDETDNGKLYINYPMIESIYAHSDNFLEKKVTSNTTYKQVKKNFKNHPAVNELYIQLCKQKHQDCYIEKISKDIWVNVFKLHLNKIRKITGQKEIDEITNLGLTKKQISLHNNKNECYDVSSLPLFVYEYLEDGEAIFTSLVI